MYTDRASMATVAFVQRLIVDSCLEFTLSLVSLKSKKKKKKTMMISFSRVCSHSAV